MNVRIAISAFVVYAWSSICLLAANHEPLHEYVDGSIHIVLPVHLATTKNGLLSESDFNDGGTRMISIFDVNGKRYDVYIDHRVDKKEQWGTVYLFAYPETPNSIRLTNQKAFKTQILDPLGLE